VSTRPLAFGAPHRHFALTDSTNERARELAVAGAPAGTVVTAGAQTAGRGRRRRTWSAPPGKALLYSAILRPLDERHALLPLAVPVAACEAISSLAPVSPAIKWPNDLWLFERKLGGVLIEARPPEWAVIGVGINLTIADDEFPADLRWPATSIGFGVAVDEARRALDRALSEWVEVDPERVLAAYRELDALAGREVSWEEAGETLRGTAAGTDERGNLLITTPDGERRALGAGEVSLRVG
jgi:BirA family biotin operon repressor/biotin-[acetyl-CoA-carboxylase] ligase